MSVVGPRPLPASDVRDSKLAYLRVLSVTPGITGLWQVEGRRIPRPIAISHSMYLYRKLEHLAGYQDHPSHHGRGPGRNRNVDSESASKRMSLHLRLHGLVATTFYN